MYYKGDVIMSIIVGVMLRRIKDKVYADAGRFDLGLNDKVILETEHGVETGVICEKEKNMQKGKDPIGKVLRKITEEDRRRLAENEKRNLKAYAIVMQKAEDYELDMKLTCVQYTFDRSKLFVYYTSEIRVDFRKLIKDLGHMLKARIQMVQISVRDESKMIGGIGTCGQVLCCQSFLKNFNSVTIDMAKDQELSLHASKLSGLCSRLMCCIAYENGTYRDIKKDIPVIGTMISMPEGKAKVAAIDCIRERVTVDFGDRAFKIFTIKQIKDNNIAN
jgi:cell fate regulator YaaT (PSP1 superfamily)